MRTLTARAAAYLAKLPPAVAGNGGHRATFAAACRLVEFGLTMDQALPLLAAWNETHCAPPWTEYQLRHKLADAFKRTSAKPYLASHVKAGVASWPVTVGLGLTLPGPSQSQPGLSRFAPVSGQRTHDQNASNAILRSRIPAKCAATGEMKAVAEKMRPGTDADIAALAALRGLSIAGVALASARGLLRFGRYHGADAWFVLDPSQRNACARRMDGKPWMDGGAKSFILRGSKAAWPIGIIESKSFPVLLLCEGAPDLLAAFHFMSERGRVTDCAPVAMLSAAYKLPAETLPAFAGKRVRIFAHDDASGYQACERWQASLAPHAREVDAFSFAGVITREGNPANDLNGFARRGDTPENENLLANLLP